MGVEFSAWAGYGVKLDFSKLTGEKSFRPACSCNDKSGGFLTGNFEFRNNADAKHQDTARYCVRCTRLMAIHDSRDDVADEIAEVLSSIDFKPYGLKFLWDGLGNGMKKDIFIGHFYTCDEGGHQFVLPKTLHSFDIWDAISRAIKENIPEYSAVAPLSAYGFYIMSVS